jgi:Ca-activated chloride channel family protein
LLDRFSRMSFAWPYLLSLVAVPFALLLWEITHRRRAAGLTRPKILRAEAGARSLKLSSFNTATAPTVSRPRYWLCAGIVLAIVALARPQWGRIEEPVFDQSREILLAIDLSRSMLTPDVRPSRLDRGKLLIQSLLERLEGERVGLLVFAGTAFLQSPLSADYEILREFLPALGPDFLPQGGSNYGALLDTAIQAFGATNSADRFLVILSDGEATDEDWRTKLAALKEKNVRVLGLGVGTAEGGMIPDGSGGLVKDERGAVVMSKLESATLQELARETNGIYRDASAWVDLAGLVNETIETGRKGQFVEKNTVRLVERFQWPLALGLWCLFVSFCYEFPVRPRVRDLKLAPETMKPTTDAGKTSAAAATSALLLLTTALTWLTPTFAAVSLAQPPTPPGSPAAKPEEPSALAKIIGRLAAVDTPTGRDWAELARETVTWGSRLQSGQQPVPEGPVRDALAAVDAGEKLDRKTADWPKLREELQALLEKKDEEKQEKQDQQNQDQQNQDQNQQQKQDQKKQDQKQKADQQKQQQSQEKDESSQSNESAGEQQKQEAKQQQDDQSAFGDMNKKEEPPPPEPKSPQDMQQVGGAEKQPEAEPRDPALALPLQKLDQLRNQDSPAHLFQLMEGERKPTKKTGKDW